MGLLDAFKKVQKVAQEHPDQVGQGIDKLEEMVEHRTGGKLDGQIEAGGEKLGQALGVPKHRGEHPDKQAGQHHRKH